MFYEAMRCSGVGPVEAKTMYYALLRFGRHWRFSVKRAKPVKVGGKIVARAGTCVSARDRGESGGNPIGS